MVDKDYAHFPDITSIEREYILKPIPKYINFWAADDEKFKTNTELFTLIQDFDMKIRSKEIAKQFDDNDNIENTFRKIKLSIRENVKERITTICQEN